MYYTTSDAQSVKYNLTSLKDQVRSTVQELVEQYKDEEVSITLTGHSMGGLLAILAATDIVYNGFNKPSASPDKAFPVTTFAFACPRLGDQGFADAFSALDGLHVLRVRNEKDPVPLAPPNKDYVVVGEELVIDTTKSPYLKEGLVEWLKTVHELEVYLHGVAGFDKEIRDIALINKHLDALKEEHRDHGLVMWWIERNKSMVQSDIDGYWSYNDHEGDDD